MPSLYCRTCSKYIESTSNGDSEYCFNCRRDFFEKNKDTCVTCKKEFIAVDRNGKPRIRCYECSQRYFQDHKGTCGKCSKVFIAVTPTGEVHDYCHECHIKSIDSTMDNCMSCNKLFRARRGDGKILEMCSPCYQDTFKDCDNEHCSNRTKKPNMYCSPCYQENKKYVAEERKRTFTNTVSKEKKLEGPCHNEYCRNLTAYTYCSTCFGKRRETERDYMISSCEGCGNRVRGNVTYCDDCY